MQMVTDSNPSKGILVPCSSSSSSSREEKFEADPSIYLRVTQASDAGLTHGWYAIGGQNPETPPEVYKFLNPVFPTPPPKHQDLSSCGVIGSTIYVLGGADYRIYLYTSGPSGSSFFHPFENDVYYIDTQNPTGGWKKGLSMLRPRAHSHPVTTVDGKMFVFGNIVKAHNKEDGDVFLMGEVFDGNCWRPLSAAPPSIIDFSRMYGHAVLDDHNRNSSKMILLHGERDPGLYIYDIESDSWNIYSKSALGYKGRIRSSAFVDGVLYFIDYGYPGVVFAVDVVDNPNPENNQPQQVLGFDEYYSIPQMADVGTPPKEFLVSLGNSKLAVLWAGNYFGPYDDGDYEPDMIAVCCSKFRMSKRRNHATDQYTFKAERLSLSRYCVEGFSLLDAIAVVGQSICWDHITGS